MSLNYIDPADPPTGMYWCVSNDPLFVSWIPYISFAMSRYCPGFSGCPSYSSELECLRVTLRIVQERVGWNGIFVINPMHVGRINEAPKHLLIIGPFMD
jgi:hypothetical protein